MTYAIGVFTKDSRENTTYTGYAQVDDEIQADVILNGFRLAGAEVIEGYIGDYLTDYLVYVPVKQ